MRYRYLIFLIIFSLYSVQADNLSMGIINASIPNESGSILSTNLSDFMTDNLTLSASNHTQNASDNSMIPEDAMVVKDNTTGLQDIYLPLGTNSTINLSDITTEESLEGVYMEIADDMEPIVNISDLTQGDLTLDEPIIWYQIITLKNPWDSEILYSFDPKDELEEDFLDILMSYTIESEQYDVDEQSIFRLGPGEEVYEIIIYRTEVFGYEYHCKEKMLLFDLPIDASLIWDNPINMSLGTECTLNISYAYPIEMKNLDLSSLEISDIDSVYHVQSDKLYSGNDVYKIISD